MTEGIEDALRRARDAAGTADVQVNGGAEIARQFLDAELVDEVRLHHVPVVLGAGTPLFDDRPSDLGLVPIDSKPSRLATHVIYRVTDSAV